MVEHLAHIDRLVAILLEQLREQDGMKRKVEVVEIVLEQLEGISIKGSFSISVILNVLEGEW